MSPSVQLILTVGIVGLAVLYLLHGLSRLVWPRQKVCRGGCGCSNGSNSSTSPNTPETFISLDQVSLRRQREPSPE